MFWHVFAFSSLLGFGGMMELSFQYLLVSSYFCRSTYLSHTILLLRASTAVRGMVWYGTLSSLFIPSVQYLLVSTYSLPSSLITSLTRIMRLTDILSPPLITSTQTRKDHPHLGTNTIQYTSHESPGLNRKNFFLRQCRRLWRSERKEMTI